MQNHKLSLDILSSYHHEIRNYLTLLFQPVTIIKEELEVGTKPLKYQMLLKFLSKLILQII